MKKKVNSVIEEIRKARGKVIFLLFLMLVAVVCGLTLQILLQLPDTSVLSSYIPSESTIIYAGNGETLARLHDEENRRVVPLSKISQSLQRAVVAVEDARFFKHHGFDPYGIIRSAFANIKSGHVVEGASTLTQQLARNLFLTHEKTFKRKIAELLLALQIERRYSKEEILEMYLNQVYWGHNAYGIESAANLYFEKPAQELNLAESAMLAGLIDGPELYSPYRNYKAAKAKQALVLNKLIEMGIASFDEAQKAYNEPLSFNPKNLKRLSNIAPYFISYILSQLAQEYDQDVVYHEGLKVYTTLDPKMQKIAEDIIAKFIESEGKKYKFSQAALVAIDPRTGYVKTMVGGVDFNLTKFNRAVQAKRSPGSAFKPFVYTAALEQGLSPGYLIEDSPVSFKVFVNKWNPEGVWEPKNFDKKYHGWVTMRAALERSLNIPSIKLMEKVGISSAMDVARRMGIKSYLEPCLALTLGASEVSLLEMTSAYGTLANNGIRVEDTSITSILDRQGTPLYRHEITEKKALDQNIAATMVDMMKGVLQRGTGYQGRIARPAAAKTGTAEEYKDAWFIGFVPQLVVGVWLGNDDNTPMKGIAEVAVAPRIWKAFMQEALVDEPVLSFTEPKGLINIQICSESNLLAGPYCPKDKVQLLTLWQKDVPTKTCNIHNEIIQDIKEEIEKPEEEKTVEPANEFAVPPKKP